MIRGSIGDTESCPRGLSSFCATGKAPPSGTIEMGGIWKAEVIRTAVDGFRDELRATRITEEHIKLHMWKHFLFSVRVCTTKDMIDHTKKSIGSVPRSVACLPGNAGGERADRKRGAK